VRPAGAQRSWSSGDSVSRSFVARSPFATATAGATFAYGEERQPGEPHVIWRRIGDDSILEHP
jgi:hypothetical protein